MYLNISITLLVLALFTCSALAAEEVSTEPSGSVSDQYQAEGALYEAEGSPQTTKAELLSDLQTVGRFGIKVPPSLVFAINNLVGRNQADQNQANQIQESSFDYTKANALKQWLRWLLEDPAKFGVHTYTNEPLVAGTQTNISHHIKLGRGISLGGGVLVAKHWQHTIEFQTDNPQQENYVTITSDNFEVEFDASTVLRQGIHGGLEADLPTPFFSLVRGELREADEIIIEYRNLVLPTLASDGFVLPLYYKQRENDYLIQFDNEYLTIHGASLQKVELITPSLVRPGFEFSAKVYMRDKFGNLAEGQFPSFDLVVDGEFFHRLNAGSEQIATIDGIKLEYGRDHSIELRSSGGGIRTRSNPIALTNTRDQIFWGDAQFHSSNSEGSSSVNHVDLDFSIPAIHESYLSEPIWRAIPGLKSWVWERSVSHGGSQQLISNWYKSNLGSQTKLVAEMLKQNVSGIALANKPLDDRFINNHQTRYVELLSNNTGFETYANTLLQKGYRLSFLASDHSHLLPLGSKVRSALTAVIAKEGEDWLSAFKRGSTYVTSGERIFLDIRVNGELPGQRAVSNETRTIAGRVKGTAGIYKIELIKNGKVIDVLKPSQVPEGDSKHLLRVSLGSESASFRSQRDLPRNGREWLGFFTSEARILSAEAPSFKDGSRQGIAVSQDNRIDFITWTRGKQSSFLVDLEINSEDLVFELNFKAGHEDIDVKPMTRPSSEISAVRQMISIFDLKDGPVKRSVKVNGYTDEIQLEFVNPDTESNVEFEFVDTDEPKEGDYYYIRIQQLDDQMAWSSPVIVGGFDQP